MSSTSNSFCSFPTRAFIPFLRPWRYYFTPTGAKYNALALVMINHSGALEMCGYQNKSSSVTSLWTMSLWEFCLIPFVVIRVSRTESGLRRFREPAWSVSGGTGTTSRTRGRTRCCAEGCWRRLSRNARPDNCFSLWIWNRIKCRNQSVDRAMNCPASFCSVIYCCRRENISVWNRRLQPSAQCMLSIDQWSRTSELNAGVSVVRLLTYSLFSAVCAPDDFFTVSDSYSV